MSLIWLGVVVRSVFGKIVSSLVSDAMMSVIGVLTGGVNFTDFKIVLKEAEGEIVAVTLNYGNFIQTKIDFIIIAFCIFVATKCINELKNQKPKVQAPKELSEDIVLLRETKDALRNR